MPGPRTSPWQGGAWISAATGQHSLSLRLINRSARACTLKGYPRVSLEDGRGTIPFGLTHRAPGDPGSTVAV